MHSLDMSQHLGLRSLPGRLNVDETDALPVLLLFSRLSEQSWSREGDQDVCHTAMKFSWGVWSDT